MIHADGELKSKKSDFGLLKKIKELMSACSKKRNETKYPVFFRNFYLRGI